MVRGWGTNEGITLGRWWTWAAARVAAGLSLGKLAARGAADRDERVTFGGFGFGFDWGLPAQRTRSCSTIQKHSTHQNDRGPHSPTPRKAADHRQLPRTAGPQPRQPSSRPQTTPTAPPHWPRRIKWPAPRSIPPPLRRPIPSRSFRPALRTDPILRRSRSVCLRTLDQRSLFLSFSTGTPPLPPCPSSSPPTAAVFEYSSLIFIIQVFDKQDLFTFQFSVARRLSGAVFSPPPPPFPASGRGRRIFIFHPVTRPTL